MKTTWKPGRLLGSALGVGLGLVLVPFASVAAEPVERRGAFGPGEQADYVLRILGLPAGTARIVVGAPTMRDHLAVWPVVASADLRGPLKSVQARFVSFWDPAAKQSLGNEYVVVEDRHARRQRIRVDPATKTAEVVGGGAGRLKTTRHSVEASAVDLLTAVFSIRDRTLAVGESFPLSVFTGTGMTHLRGYVENKRVLETAGGPRDVFTLTLLEQPESGRHLGSTLFLTTDSVHLPVRLELRQGWGAVAVELLTYQSGAAGGDQPFPSPW